MLDDIDWENACNDFHPDFALVRSAGRPEAADPGPPTPTLKQQRLRQLFSRLRIRRLALQESGNQVSGTVPC